MLLVEGTVRLFGELAPPFIQTSLPSALLYLARSPWISFDSTEEIVDDESLGGRLLLETFLSAMFMFDARQANLMTRRYISSITERMLQPTHRPNIPPS